MALGKELRTGRLWEGHDFQSCRIPDGSREGHDFSRAALADNKSGFSRWGFASVSVRISPAVLTES
jgi:hypothetical protein